MFCGDFNPTCMFKQFVWKNKFQLCQISAQFTAICAIHKLLTVSFYGHRFASFAFVYCTSNEATQKLYFKHMLSHIFVVVAAFVLLPWAMDSTHVCPVLWLQNVTAETKSIDNSSFVFLFFVLSFILCTVSLFGMFLFVKVICHFCCNLNLHFQLFSCISKTFTIVSFADTMRPLVCGPIKFNDKFHDNTKRLCVSAIRRPHEIHLTSRSIRVAFYCS